MTDRERAIKAQIEDTILLARFLQRESGAIALISDVITRAFKEGKKVLLLGNGGSAADAQHIAAELSGKFRLERRPLPALALTADSTLLTALANDYGFEKIFVRQLQGLLVKGDVVIGISTSGSSPNVLSAMEEARRLGAVTIALTGDGGRLEEMVDYALCIPTRDTARMQEAHIMAGHLICFMVEENMFGDGLVSP